MHVQKSPSGKVKRSFMQEEKGYGRKAEAHYWEPGMFLPALVCSYVFISGQNPLLFYIKHSFQFSCIPLSSSYKQLIRDSFSDVRLASLNWLGSSALIMVEHSFLHLNFREVAKFA